MLNEVKHLYNKDSSLTLGMTVSVIIYIVTLTKAGRAASQSYDIRVFSSER